MVKYKKIKYFRGFTLVEVMVVMLIIGVLVALSIPIGIRTYNSALSTKAKTHIKMFTDAARDFKSDHGSITNNMPVGGLDDDAQVYTCTHVWGQANASTYVNAYGQGGSGSYIGGLAGVGLENRPLILTLTKKQYLKIPEIDRSEEVYSGGLTYNASDGNAWGMLDPWGNAYVLLIDRNADMELSITTSAMGDFSGKDLAFGEVGVGLICFGPDRDSGGGDDIGIFK